MVVVELVRPTLAALALALVPVLVLVTVLVTVLVLPSALFAPVFRRCVLEALLL